MRSKIWIAAELTFLSCHFPHHIVGFLASTMGADLCGCATTTLLKWFVIRIICWAFRHLQILKDACMRSSTPSMNYTLRESRS